MFHYFDKKSAFWSKNTYPRKGTGIIKAENEQPTNPKTRQ